MSFLRDITADDVVGNALYAQELTLQIQAFTAEHFLSDQTAVSAWLYSERRNYRTVIAVLSPSSLGVITKVHALRYNYGGTPIHRLL